MRAIEALAENWVKPEFREELGYPDRLGELAEAILAGTATEQDEDEALDIADGILNTILEGE